MHIFKIFEIFKNAFFEEYLRMAALRHDIPDNEVSNKLIVML